MMNDDPPKKVLPPPNVYMITDNTYSMRQACLSSKQTSAEVTSLCNLLTGCSCVTVGVIGDYDSATVDHHKGGFSLLRKDCVDEKERKDWFDKYMQPAGGGGLPEAYKTALNFLLQEPPGILLLFLDALPHGISGPLDKEGQKELAFLQERKMITPWKELVNAVKTGGFTVVTFVTGNFLNVDANALSTYADLGYVVPIIENNSTVISNVMLRTLYMLLGQRTDVNSAEAPITFHYRDIVSGEIMRTDRITAHFNIDMLTQMQNADPDFVLSTFGRLLNKHQPENALCLTTNPVLGKYWRLICGTYRTCENGKYEKKCQQTIDQLSQVVNLLTRPADKKCLQDWIAASYDNTPTIRDMVQTIIRMSSSSFYNSSTSEFKSEHKQNNEFHVFVLPLQWSRGLTRDDVLNLGRGGESFTIIAQVISEIQVASSDAGVDHQQYSISNDVDVCPNFIPMYDNQEVSSETAMNTMRLIGNLLSPKYLFPKTVAMMAAIIALRNRHLHDYAEKVLQDNIGKWIDWSVNNENKQTSPVFWSLNFMKLLKLAPDNLFTPEEICFREKFFLALHLLQSQHSRIAIDVPLISDKPRVDTTWKFLCETKNGGC